MGQWSLSRMLSFSFFWVVLPLLFVVSTANYSFANHDVAGAWVEDPALTGCNHCHNLTMDYNGDGRIDPFPIDRLTAYSPANSTNQREPHPLRDNWSGTVTIMNGKEAGIVFTSTTTAYLNTWYNTTIPCDNATHPLQTSCATAATFTLTVTKAGTGTGTVTSNPAGINCGADCSEPYNSGTVVTLTATAASGSVFAGWSGDADCSDGVVTMNANMTCTAFFNIQTFTLTVTKAGSGTGTVTSSPAGINCGADCNEIYNTGTVVTLTATPDPGSRFVAWSGDPDCTDGSVTMNANKTCTATFNQIFTLSVTKAGSGTGTVTSNPTGINCGADCTEIYDSGTVVSLAAMPDPGSRFVSWSGDPDCTDGSVTMNANKTCTATFNSAFTLTVTKSGTGGGTVTSNPAGINCGADCSEPYDGGTVVFLTATPDPGSEFAGWSGNADCSDGVVTMDANKTCTATFNLSSVTFTLTITKAGTGTGTVTSSPAGINCGVDCSEPYPNGTIVTLTATPGSGSIFTGWSGFDPDCSDGMVTVNANKGCTAVFDQAYTLTVAKTGTGTGTVMSIPAGINCGPDCTEVYATDTVVVLVPSPAIDSSFTGWSGAADCSDGVVTMTASLSCTATFDITTTPNFTLTVSKAGAGSGTVTSSPVGINCGADCTEIYPSGTVVDLIATPAAGSTFAGWSGDADCSDGSVTMDTNKDCTATFNATTAARTWDVEVGPTNVYTVHTSANPADFGTSHITIYQGDTIHWTWSDTNHSVTSTSSPDGQPTIEPCVSGEFFNSLKQDPPYNYDHTFVNTTGSTDCRYFCVTHSTGMHGNVTVLARAGNTAPTAPTNLQANVVGYNWIQLSWNASSDTVGVVAYNIYRNGTLIATKRIELGSTNTSFADETGQANQTYTYTVRAVDGASAESGASNAFTVTTTSSKFWEIQIISNSYVTVTSANVSEQGTNHITIYRGDKIRWTWLDNNHSVTSSIDGQAPQSACSSGDTFNSGIQNTGATFTNEFNHNATPAGQPCLYFCLQHASIRGQQITILEPGAAPASSTLPAAVTSTFTLIGTKAGTGSGTVTSSPAGINCGVDCSEPYTSGTVVTLTATPDPGSVFTGWVGSDADCSDGVVTVNNNTTCAAVFKLAYSMSVSKAGSGTGTVTSSPAGINCGADCSEIYPRPTVVLLGTTPDSGSTFAGWSGDADCSDGVVTMTGNRTCTATFNTTGPVTFTLSVTKAGTGTGTVTSSPAGINCGVDCSEPYTSGTTVTLTATADAGSVFASWSGSSPDCSDGIVTVNANITCTAVFNQAYTLTVTKAGAGTGTVTSSPAGINCGADCSESYASGTVVTLTATPNAGSVFAGWSGDADCSDGIVTMNASKTCTANFNPTFTLTVTKAGAGTGTVTSSPAGINCGADCSEPYASGTVVTLTATPDAGSVFAAWSGDPDCTDGMVTMNANKTCTATFDPAPTKLGNISTRAFVGTGVNEEIGGFIISGTSPKQVLIRARGPSMSGAPFNYSGTLANPTVQLYSFAVGGFIAQNDDWQVSDPLCAASGYSCGTPTQITATGKDPCQPNPGQTSPPPGCTQESAILITLPPGNYGAIVTGVNGGTGLGLVEVFDMN